MRIAVIGSGYVGLVTGACFSDFGVDVTCVDNDTKKVEQLTAGQKMPIYEPGLQEMVVKNKQEGRLRFTTDLKSAVEDAEVVFIAVGTPPSEDGSADLSAVLAVAESIAKCVNDYKVIVTKSTVPVGTGKKLRELVGRHVPAGVKFGIVSNPEFLREGNAIHDFMQPDRVVIGTDDERARRVMHDLYRPLDSDTFELEIVDTSIEAAELTKYAANAFLATKISFINEVANLCDLVGCDVKDVAKGIGMDQRIGKQFLNPGPGFGGSCFPKDTKALATVARAYGGEMRIVDTVIDVNQRQRDAMVPKIEKLTGSLAGKVIGILGLSFKADTDDMREAPSVEIIQQLVERGATVKAFDPEAEEEAQKVLPPIEYVKDEYAAAEGADVLVFMTEWHQFSHLNMKRIAKLMRTLNIADLRNLCDPEEMSELGFNYCGVGRQGVKQPQSATNS